MAAALIEDMSSYGVSRVYSQQCGYVLADITSLRDKMKGTELVFKEMELDPDVGKTRYVTAHNTISLGGVEADSTICADRSN